MADNYIGNRMDDYMAGRLKSAAPRRLTPSGRRPGELALAVEPGATVWISEGAYLPAGQRLVGLIADTGLRIAYRAESGKAGAELAVRLGARHYPPYASAPEAELTVSLSEGSITIDSGRVRISHSPETAEQAAEIAAAFLTSGGSKALSAEIEL